MLTLIMSHGADSAVIAHVLFCYERWQWRDESDIIRWGSK